jgi:hypothetical protein
VKLKYTFGEPAYIELSSTTSGCFAGTVMTVSGGSGDPKEFEAWLNIAACLESGQSV